MSLEPYIYGQYRISRREDDLAILFAQLKIEFPKLKIIHKRSSAFHHILNFFIIVFTFGFNRKYFSTYTTTFKNRIYLSDYFDKIFNKIEMSDLDRLHAWCMLKHELVHLRQFKKYSSVLMGFAWFLPFPLFAALGRAYIEKSAYEQTFQCWLKASPDWVTSKEAEKYYINNFVGSNYGWMALIIWWLPRRWYKELLEKSEKNL